MSEPLILDGFCGAGGAGTGYAWAGFRPIGVDNRLQQRYPYGFLRADMLNVLQDREFMEQFQFVHVSPPCQFATVLLAGRMHRHVNLIDPVRELLQSYPHLTWVIENVPGARKWMRDPVTVCGTALGNWDDDLQMELRRHRLFESNVPLVSTECNHGTYQVCGVYGTGGAGFMSGGAYKGTDYEQAAVMGIDWMTRKELSQAIPPSYTKWIGAQLLAVH